MNNLNSVCNDIAQQLEDGRTAKVTFPDPEQARVNISEFIEDIEVRLFCMLNTLSVKVDAQECKSGVWNLRMALD